MVAVHKIGGELYEDSYVLIALHSSLEDYAMVYAINLGLKSNFKRSTKDLSLSDRVSFPCFEWKDNINERYWTLIANHSLKEMYLAGEDLFKNELSLTTHYLVPEHKEVDYFLKIEQDDLGNTEEVVKLLYTIPKVQTAYIVDSDKLKSKNHLIF